MTRTLVFWALGSNIAAFFIFIYPKTYAKVSAGSVIQISEPLLVRIRRTTRRATSSSARIWSWVSMRTPRTGRNCLNSSATIHLHQAMSSARWRTTLVAWESETHLQHHWWKSIIWNVIRKIFNFWINTVSFR